MGLTALVMAGGRGSRMGGDVEKPLLEISGKSMLQHVIDVLTRCHSLDRIVVASSRNTPATTAEAEKLGAETIITPGNGFEEDMRFAIRHLSLGEVLVISSDLPLVTVDVIEEAYEKYREAGKPTLAVMAPAELYERFGSKPEYVLEMGGRRLVPVGINVIDGGRINDDALEQAELVIDSEDVAINVNTPEELEAARKRLVDVRGKT
jgi:adenosylcobinamide-phosphate guanylyltransferase